MVPQGNEAEVLWLNWTNIILGLVVLVCFVLVAGAGALDVIGRLRKRSAAYREIDHDMEALGSFDDHAFHTPELGLTMADGGERVDEPKNKDA